MYMRRGSGPSGVATAVCVPQCAWQSSASAWHPRRSGSEQNAQQNRSRSPWGAHPSYAPRIPIWVGAFGLSGRGFVAMGSTGCAGGAAPAKWQEIGSNVEQPDSIHHRCRTQFTHHVWSPCQHRCKALHPNYMIALLNPNDDPKAWYMMVHRIREMWQPCLTLQGLHKHAQGHPKGPSHQGHWQFYLQTCLRLNYISQQ